MLKKFLIRHRLTALVFVPLLALFIIPWGNAAFAHKDTAPPPPPVMTESAIASLQGITVQWLPSHSDTHPVMGYTIEASRSDQEFIVIAQVERTSTSYIDPDGKVGDRYRIRAFDDQGLSSVPSDPLVARKSKPGEEISTTLELTAAPSGSYADLTTQLVDAFQSLSTHTSQSELVSLSKNIGTIQVLQRTILEQSSTAQTAEKQRAADACRSNDQIIHAVRALVPEKFHIELTVIEASCIAIERAV